MPRFSPSPSAAGRRDPLPLAIGQGGSVGRLVPAGPRRGRWILAWLLASLLLHGLLALRFTTGPREVRDLPPPAIEVVFEGGQPLMPLDEPPPGVSSPSEPPAIPAPQPAPLAPQPSKPPPPAPPTPQPSPPPPPAPPSEPLTAERAEDALPAPPPPAPPLPPRPPAARRPALALPPGVLWAPGGVQLGQSARQAAPAGRPAARGLDLNVAPRILEGEASADANLRVTGAEVGADWRAAFRRWLDQNISYPLGALREGESGTVRVRVVAGPDGRVRSVRLTGPSGSPSLNFGTTFPFSGAQLPAFPPPADPEGVTIDLTVRYVLLRR